MDGTPAHWTLGLALLGGVGIAAACGLRAFLPLLLLGLAGRAGWVPLAEAARWLASTPALLALGTATVVEIAGDKIPAVDHALDVLGTALRPAAAWLGAYAVLGRWPAPWSEIAALVLGGGALLVHGAKAKLRLGSSLATLGHLNPVLSVGEDLTALGLIVAALVAPALILVVLLAAAWLLVRRTRRKRPA